MWLLDDDFIEIIMDADEPFELRRKYTRRHATKD